MVCVMVIVVIILTVSIMFNYFLVPQHVRNSEKEDNDTELTDLMIDRRVKDALDSGKNYIMEDIGVDTPFSSDLLHTLEKHFEVTLNDLGAGLFQGDVAEGVVIELIKNKNGNVGQVQIRIAENAGEVGIKEALAKYVRFLNTNINDTTVMGVVEEALPNLQNLKPQEMFMYSNHGVGFVGKVSDNQLSIYIP